MATAVMAPGSGLIVVKGIVRNIKRLAREFAGAIGDSELLRRIERAMEAEEETVAKRRASLRARQGAGA